MKFQAVFLFLLISSVSAEETGEQPVLDPGKVLTWEVSNDHQGKTQYVRYGIDDGYLNDECIVHNADGSVRGRSVRIYKNGRPHMTLAYRGMSEVWFTEVFTWKADGSYTAEIREVRGALIFKAFVPADDSSDARYEDAAGNELSKKFIERWGAEIGDTLY